MYAFSCYLTALMGLAPLSARSVWTAPHETLAPAGSNVWWVDASGTGLGTGTSSDPFTNISFGVSRPFVLNGDLVLVAPGTYTNEEIDFLGKSLTVRSTDGPEATTIVALPQLEPFTPHPAARVTSGELRVFIEGFRITGGTGSLQCSAFTTVAGGAIEVCAGSTLTVRNCVFDGSIAERGGAIYAQDSTLRVEDCLFTGPGTEARGEAIYLANSEAVVQDSLFMDLYLVSPDEPRGGGAVVADESALLLERCIFERNATRFLGGHLWSRSGDVTVNSCAFGQSTGFAGAAISASGGILRIFDSSVKYARAIEAPGAGVFGSSADIRISGTLFEGNFVDGTREGGAVAVQAGRLSISHSRFLRNTAWEGGGIATSQSAQVTIQDCCFEGNAASMGGGALFAAPAPGDPGAEIERSVFIVNSALPAGSGGAIQGPARLEQCSLRGNAAGTTGGAATGGTELLRSIAWANAPADLDPSVVAEASMIGEPSGATVLDPVAGPPLFWSNFDLHVLPGSPAIDAVDPEQGFDPDGSAMDLGAFVFDSAYCPVDCPADAGVLGCVSAVNSTGAVSELGALGSLNIETNRLVLLNTQLPPAAPALMLASQLDGFQAIPGTEGPLCLGAPFLRLLGHQAVSRPDGTLATWVQLTTESGLPASDGLYVQAGETWFFQLWYRDSLGTTGTNTSNSMSVTLR